MNHFTTESAYNWQELFIALKEHRVEDHKAICDDFKTIYKATDK